jgi:IMP dehydrogenase
MNLSIIPHGSIGLTFDDILLRPAYSDILPSDVSLKTWFSRRIPMNIPLVSSAMDTVTESRTAIVMAQSGGIGVIHRNLSAEDQAIEVEKVKKYESGMIVDPITVYPHDSVQTVLDLMKKFRISGVPVVDESQRLVGIITNRDLRFLSHNHHQVSEVMTKDRLITVSEGTQLDEAKVLLQKYRIEKLPVVDHHGKLKGMITVKDIEKSMDYPHANKDSYGRLRVAAAVGVGDDELQRARSLVQKHVDALVIDTAHGHSKKVFTILEKLKKEFPDIDIVAGNVATGKGCLDLINAGADAIKIGCGPGSICTTRIVAGIGVPQMSAILECAEVSHQYKIPLIGDGGIKYSGDIVKALAGGAYSVMIGSLFAGTDEAPGETILYHGRSYRVYRGMGSLEAMKKGSKERYGQADVEESSKFVPEGVEGQVPSRGPLGMTVYQLTGGIRSGMGYVGASTVEELQQKADFIQMTAASLRESHPHDIKITKESPNYHLSS